MGSLGYTRVEEFMSKPLSSELQEEFYDRTFEIKAVLMCAGLTTVAVTQAARSPRAHSARSTSTPGAVANAEVSSVFLPTLSSTATDRWRLDMATVYASAPAAENRSLASRARATRYARRSRPYLSIFL